MKFILCLVSLCVGSYSISQPQNSNYFVFIGKKISVDYVPPPEGELAFDAEFLAHYEILETVRGRFEGTEIVFSVFDHYGEPPFTNYEHVLLYVQEYEGQYYHAKYQFSPLYMTVDGRWASSYAWYDYTHSYNEDTAIRPEPIEFVESVTEYISSPPRLQPLHEDQVKIRFPEPYFKIEGNLAIALYGNYVEELFLLKQSGVLNARGDFQDF